MGITCETVWRESSNYLEGDLAPELRLAMDEHIQGCKECASVMDGLRNVVTLYGDERMYELPVGFSQRLQRKLQANEPPTRRQFFGWAVAAVAASVVAVGSFELLHHTTQEKAVAPPHKPKPVPPDMQVVVADGGQHFHRATCPLLQGRSNPRTITAAEAIHEGFGPCPQCMSEYL